MRKETAYWTCKDGRRLRICDMDDRHLLNTIRFLERALEDRKACPPPSFQGEMAQFFADMEWEAMQELDTSDAYPIYDKLVADARRRGLIHE